QRALSEGPGGSVTDPDAIARRVGGEPMPFSPVVDGEVIPERPLEAVRNGTGADKDVLVGATSEEFNMVARMSGGSLDGDRLGAALTAFGLDDTGVASYRTALPDAEAGLLLGQ